MKKKVYSFVLSLVAALAAVPAWGQDATGGTVTQPRFGKQTVTVQTGQELTFYDPKGTAGIESNAANNTQSLTVFKPAEKGMAVQVTFDKTDVTTAGTTAGCTYTTATPTPATPSNGHRR